MVEVYLEAKKVYAKEAAEADDAAAIFAKELEEADAAEAREEELERIRIKEEEGAIEAERIRQKEQKEAEEAEAARLEAVRLREEAERVTSESFYTENKENVDYIIGEDWSACPFERSKRDCSEEAANNEEQMDYKANEDSIGRSSRHTECTGIAG